MAKRGFIFNSVQAKREKRNAFNLSYENKLSCNMGELIPFYVQDVLPNDSFKVSNEYLMRAQPLLAPLMHRVDIYQHYFFVPLRLIWKDFPKFITGGETGEEVVEAPYFSSSKILNPSSSSLTSDDKKQIKLLDCLGYPGYLAGSTAGAPQFEKLSSLRVRAYNLIYNEFYRDQNFNNTAVLNSTDNGLDTGETINMKILNRCWKKDYFTSALPFAQRGDTVNIPFTGGEVVLRDPAQEGVNAPSLKSVGGASGTLISVSGDVKASGLSATPAYLDPNNSLGIDNLEISINDFRRANALQRWLERNARNGSRYVEQILSHFGIHPSDYRLQRPQYLGGGKQPFGISDVVQTSATAENETALGTLAGRATGINSQFVFNETFEEHGIIIGLLSVLPRTSYQQGCSRHLQKFDRFDYAWPSFGNLGEQEVLNKELYCATIGLSADVEANNAIFGYQSRYAEYKYTPDEVHGDFRSSLNYWHLGRIFANRPLLNNSFVTSDPSKRIFAVEDEGEDALLFDIYNNVTAVRCLPAYGTPTI